MANDTGRRLDEHEEVHDQFDRRITQNENFRLQAQGAIKTIALIVGSGGLGYVMGEVAGLL